MAGPKLRLNVRISGANEVLKALGDLPRDADRELSAEAFDIAKSVTDWIKIAARNDTRQSARAATSVREVKAGAWPAISAGGTKRANGVLFGSEFGMTRRSGWYARGRYRDSLGRQFRPHMGSSSYWFFRTVEREQPWIESQWHQAADAVVRKWGA